MGFFDTKASRVEKVINSGLAKAANTTIGSLAIKSTKDTVLYNKTTSKSDIEYVQLMQLSLGSAAAYMAELTTGIIVHIANNAKFGNYDKMEIMDGLITAVNDKYDRAKLIANGSTFYESSKSVVENDKTAIYLLKKSNTAIMILLDLIANINLIYTKTDFDVLYQNADIVQNTSSTILGLAMQHAVNLLDTIGHNNADL